MNSHQTLNTGELHLDSSSAITWFAPGAGLLRVERGAAWITKSGVADDIVLRAGETLRVAAGDELTVGALMRGLAVDVSWRQSEERAPSALDRLSAAWHRQTALLAHRTRDAVRRLSLTEIDVQSV